ncbi:type IV secretion system protein [Aliarcobacter butzleri]|uniref:type IV secretion system protein n=1 Tax=Aliarcobacter butzleri TaxID=28197 RepID=UPI003AF9C73D
MNTGSTFFQGLGNFTNKIFEFLGNSDIQPIIQAFASLFGITVTLIVTLEAYQVMAGKSENPIRELVWKLASAMLIISVALNQDGFLDAIKLSFEELHYMMSGDMNLYAKLDRLYDEAINLANTTYQTSPNSFGGAILGIFCMILIYAGFIISTVPAFLIIAFSELTLKLLLMLLPIAIYSLVYKFSKQIFQQWVNMFISNALTVLIVGLLLSAVLETYTRWQVDLMTKITSDVDITAIALQSLIMGILLLGLVKIAKDIAEKLGTVSIEAIGSSLGNQISNSAKNTATVGKGAMNTYSGAKTMYQDTKDYIASKQQYKPKIR